MFGSIFETWMLAMALTEAAKRKEEKRMAELDRAEINSLYGCSVK